ncbi:PREDICTED: uncharacterized protein LOC105560234 [Vollenhovia emeryi]|uniref:uncharacterized protein LOC105560234 n=1 Tax=Vollenhovia emeryi TaxID=411798 RepID=UPI0005F3CAB0|nr:PREDICTED: uncharacterized protein LOC105560234 [Vollenhovia emeryi]
MARSMAPLYDGHDYYKRMFELQEKLRKSEEERIRLEERFNVLMRESRSRHDICINRLRMRYIQYLEEQRTRDERNHKLLAALDGVMNKLALISAKKDRLNVLRKQYEAYLLRAYANHRPPGSVTGDSGIASQNEDKYTTRKTVAMAHPDLAPAETRSVSSPRMHQGAPDPQPSQPRAASRFHDQIAVDASLNNPPPVLTAAPIGATLDVDHRQTSVPRGSYVYAPLPNAHQYLRIPSNYDKSAPRSLQHIPDISISYADAPVLPVAPPDDTRSQAVPVNRFFREHVESARAAPGLSATARFPVGDASRNVPAPRQFDPLTLLQYHDANILLSDPRLQRGEYDPSDAAAVGPTLVTGKSSTYRTGASVNVANEIGPLPGYMDYVLPSAQRSDDEGSTRSITSDDLDGLIRRNERLLWGKAEIARTPCRPPIPSGVDNANLDENDMTALVENELDRYISNIRKLHREHGAQSLDELDHEQNTSGDLLNVSLSEDALELPAEDRARKERVPEEMGKILALASDLASRTANLKEVARDSAGQSGSVSSPTEVEDGIRRRESDASELKGKREAEGRATSVRSEIRDDVATRSAKLERPRGDTKIARENWNNADASAGSRERDREASAAKKDNANEETAASDDPRNALEEKRLDLVTGEESNIENLLDAAEELAPWDLASVQKQVRELHLDDSDGDRAAARDAEDTVDRIREEVASESGDSSRFIEQSGVNDQVENAPPRSEVETTRLDSSEASEIEGQNQTASIEVAENVPSKVPSQQPAGEAEITSQPGEALVGEPNGGDGRKGDETTELRVDERREGAVKDSGYSVEQGYLEDPSQVQQYEQQDPNQQYYDPNIPYEAGNEEYERYADQGYAQEGQEYVEYVDSQYEQYPEDQQYQDYSNAQYEQDPNQAYDYGYDPNQGYGDPGQQYDPNQGYENSPDNQAYDYTEQLPYDANQTYDTAYEQEYKEEQRDDAAGDRAEKPETEEATPRQADPESERKPDADGDAVNGAGQPRKKRDVIKSLLDSDTDTTIERNVSNTESDFDFN